MSIGPSTLPEDIYRLLDDETDHVVNEDNVEKAGEIFKELLRSRFKKRPALRGEEVLRFSSIGKQDRQIWYDAHEPEKAEKLDGKTKFKFLYGDMIEILLLFCAKEAGHEVTNEQYEVNEDGVTGHIDAEIDGVLVDVKSASPYSFEKFKSGSFLFDDPFGYVIQLAGYANKRGKKEAGFLVCDKVSGNIHFASLDEAYIRGNQPADRIRQLRSVIASETPPARCFEDEPDGKSGNRKLGISCSYCKHKNTCWADANGGKGLRKFMYSGKPRWLTNVVKEPRVDEEA